MTDLTVEVAWQPTFELMVSLQSYFNPTLQKATDLGTGWRSRVRQSLPPGFAAWLAGMEKDRTLGQYMDLLGRLVWSWRGHPGGVEEFLVWAAGLDLGELYAMAAANAEPDSGVPSDLEASRQAVLRLVGGWQQHYFTTVDPALLAGLEREALARQASVPQSDPLALIEDLSNGMAGTPDPSIEHVILMPQHHARPWLLMEKLGSTMLILYAADVEEPQPGFPPIRLVRMARALDDESRLRILRLVAEAPRSFTEIVNHVGLAKSTVHHHLVALRAAGFLRIEIRLGQAFGDRYSLRRAGLQRLAVEIDRYLDYATAPAQAPNA